MTNLHDFHRRARIVAAMLAAMLAVGCVRPLAVQDGYFSPLSGSISSASVRARHAVSHQGALQAARRGCASVPTGEAPPEDGPDLGSVAAREALAALCATPVRSPVAAFGATSNSYRRWVEDLVRELPEAAETAAGAAGGS